MSPQTQITLPAALVERFTAAGRAMGMDLPTYLLFLEQCRAAKLDADAQEAARFMLSEHDDSLRKRSQ